VVKKEGLQTSVDICEKSFKVGVTREKGEKDEKESVHYNDDFCCLFIADSGAGGSRLFGRDR
jgi:hypothetical protein